MNKNIILSLAAGVVLTLGVLVTGCGEEGTNAPMDMSTNVPDMNTGGDGGMQPSCVQNPVTDTDFLNSCPPGNVVSVPITPQFPTNAPNGVLPSLP